MFSFFVVRKRLDALRLYRATVSRIARPVEWPSSPHSHPAAEAMRPEKIPRFTPFIGLLVRRGSGETLESRTHTLLDAKSSTEMPLSRAFLRKSTKNHNRGANACDASAFTAPSQPSNQMRLADSFPTRFSDVEATLMKVSRWKEVRQYFFLNCALFGCTEKGISGMCPDTGHQRPKNNARPSSCGRASDTGLPPRCV